jgi:hypothetical protein
MSKIFIIFFLTLSFPLYSQEEFDRNVYFETEDFRKDPSTNHVGMVYICADLSKRNKYASDSEVLLEKFRVLSKISVEYSQLLKDDAVRWWALKPQKKDYKFLWDDMCAIPENNMRTFFSKSN